MKKTSKLFGAVVCSAALALGCAAPAFAVPNAGEVTNTKNYEEAVQAGNASSLIAMKTQNTQISVSVPMNIAFYAESAGGALGVPSANTYHIDNSSAVPVYITKINCAYNTANANGKMWKFKTLDGTETPSPSSTAPDFRGDFALTMQYNETGSTATKGETIALGVDTGTGAAKDVFVGTKSKTLKIEKKGATDATPFHFDFIGYSSILNTVDATATDQAIDLTYTISVNPEVTSASNDLAEKN